jgi:hypothetical protein
MTARQKASLDKSLSRSLRRPRTAASRLVRRAGRAFDATIEADPPAPEAVFDRVTGPFASDEDL